jgi:hypothetical protein
MDSALPPASKAKKTATVFWALGCAGVLVLGLAAVAGPKFLVFSCRSGQSEAKVGLAGLLTAEEEFHRTHGFYSSDLAKVNWRPDGAPRYLYGFAQASEQRPDLEDYDPGRRTTADPRVVATNGSAFFSVAQANTKSGRPLTDGDFRRAVPLAVVTSNGFIAGAVGDLVDNGKDAFDVWTINERKELTVLVNDCNR